MNFNKRIKSNFNYRVYHERRRAARKNVDQNLRGNNFKIKRENNVNNKLKERKHLLNIKLKKLRKVKKENEYKYQSSNFSDKKEIRKKFERENKKLEDEIRDINNEKKCIIRLREVNNRLIRENRNIKIGLDESRNLKNENHVLMNKKENIIEASDRSSQILCMINNVIQYLRKWLTML